MASLVIVCLLSLTQAILLSYLSSQGEQLQWVLQDFMRLLHHLDLPLHDLPLGHLLKYLALLSPQLNFMEVIYLLYRVGVAVMGMNRHMPDRLLRQITTTADFRLLARPARPRCIAILRGSVIPPRILSQMIMATVFHPFSPQWKLVHISSSIRNAISVTHAVAQPHDDK